MKRLFILASAAALMLASCAKTTVVYNEAPEEIGFRAINMPMTRASSTYTESLGVSAYKITGNTAYFENKEFTLAEGVWTGGQYWPLTDALGFVAYGPGTSCATSIITSTTTITATGVNADVDFVYSKEYVNNEGAGYTKANVPDAGVPIELAHAKSMIEIEVTVVGTNETVTAVELLSAGGKGDCAISLTGGEPSWTNPTTQTFDFTTTKTHYVIPGTPTDLRITYDTTSPATIGLTHTIDLNDDVTMKDGSDNVVTGWKPGYSYEYTVTITSKEIKVAATVEPWVPTTGSSDL